MNSKKNKLIASVGRYPKNLQRSCLFFARAVVNPFRRYRESILNVIWYEYRVCKRLMFSQMQHPFE